MRLEISGSGVKSSRVWDLQTLHPSLGLLRPASHNSGDRSLKVPRGDKSLPDDVCLHARGGLKDERDGRAVLVVFGPFLAILAAVLYRDLLSSCRHGKNQHRVCFCFSSQRAPLDGFTPFKRRHVSLRIPSNGLLICSASGT